MSFTTASLVTRTGTGAYTATLQPGWDIFGVTNGGYLLATTARAMGEEANGRVLASITGRYLNPTGAGPVTIDVEELKEGRSTSTLQAKMLEGGRGRPLLTANATFVDRTTEPPEVAISHGAPPELPNPADCVRLVPSEEAPLPPPFTAKVEIYLHPDDTTYGQARPEQVPMMRGWLRLTDGDLLDPYSLVLASDAFPPAIFNSELPPTWTPTIDLTVQIREPGPHEWVKCRFSTRFVTGGWLEEDGEIWDESGSLVALSRQLALVGR